MSGEIRDERRELEAAGWEPEERGGQTVWWNLETGFVYPQGVAIAIVQERADPDVPLSPEGGA